jgi:hypothetical protein
VSNNVRHLLEIPATVGLFYADFYTGLYGTIMEQLGDLKLFRYLSNSLNNSTFPAEKHHKKPTLHQGLHKSLGAKCHVYIYIIVTITLW